MARDVHERTGQLLDERRPSCARAARTSSASVRRPRRATHGLGERAVEHAGGAVVERVRERELRMRELEAVAAEVERRERGRAGRERMDRRAHVVAVARERQLLGAGAAADVLGRFEHEDRAPLVGEERGRGEAVRARADDDRVVLVCRHERSLALPARASLTRVDPLLVKMTRRD